MCVCVYASKARLGLWAVACLENFKLSTPLLSSLLLQDGRNNILNLI